MKKSRVLTSESTNNFKTAVYDMFGVGNPEGKKPATEDAPVMKPENTPTVDINNCLTAPKGASYLAAGCYMEGILKVDGDLEILGEFKGTLEVSGCAVLHSDTTANISAANLRLVGCKLIGDCHVTDRVDVDGDSAVEGNISASSLNCSGRINGDVLVEEQAAFRSTARLNGNVETKAISVERGAQLQGAVKM